MSIYEYEDLDNFLDYPRMAINLLVQGLSWNIIWLFFLGEPQQRRLLFHISSYA